jgi:microcystin-dependent protein
MYVLPRDPRTGLQVDQRHFFYDVTKMTRSAGALARAAFRTWLGSRWFTAFFEFATTEPNGAWDFYAAIYDVFSDEEKVVWQDAPYLATWSDPGLIWFCVANMAYYAGAQFGCVFGINHGFYPHDPAIIRDWWERGLTGIGSAGDIEDDSPTIFYYNGGWETFVDALATDGHYARHSGNTVGLSQFVFYGSRVAVTFIGFDGGGTVRVALDNVEVDIVNLSRPATEYGIERVYPCSMRGLHQLDIAADVDGVIGVDKFFVTGSLPRVAKAPTAGIGSNIFPAGGILPYVGLTAPAAWLFCDGASLLRAKYSNLFNVIGTTYGAVDAEHFSLPDLRGRALVGAGTGAGGGASGAGLVAGGAALTARQSGDWWGAESVALDVDGLPEHAHGVTDAGHVHGVTDKGHNHLQNAHTHIQDDHFHGIYKQGVAGVGNNAMLPAQTLSGVTYSNSTRAVNQNTTPTNRSAVTGLTVGYGAGGVSVDVAGGGGGHDNLPPSLAVNWIIKI